MSEDLQQVQQETASPAAAADTPTTKKKFYPIICTPYETFVGEKPAPTPFLVDGLLTESGFSVLGAKGKHGKSSFSRIETVAVVKGADFLGRKVEPGEVLLCALEDSRTHVDNCLHALGYDLKKDARIYPVYKLSRNFRETIDFINDTVAKYPNIKFVVLDTLGKTVRAKKIDSYDEMLPLCENLFDLSTELKIHIQAIGHCKKVEQNDPFDNFLGSAEIRNSTHTNIVIFERNNRRWIQSEAKMGIAWEATELNAEVVTVDGCEIVKEFYLGQNQEHLKEQTQAANDKMKVGSVDSELVNFLRERGGSAPYAEYLRLGHGRMETKRDAVKRLSKKSKIVRITGVERSPTNPQILHLVNPPAVVASKTEQLQKAEEQLQGKREDVVNYKRSKEKCIKGGHGDGAAWDSRIKELEAEATELEARVAELKQPTETEEKI